MLDHSYLSHPSILFGYLFRLNDGSKQKNPDLMEDEGARIEYAITMTGHLKIYNLDDETSVLTDWHVIQIVKNNSYIVILNNQGEVIVMADSRLHAGTVSVEDGWLPTGINLSGITWYQISVASDIRMIASSSGPCRLLNNHGVLFKLTIAKRPTVSICPPLDNSEVIDIRWSTVVTIENIHIEHVSIHIPRISDASVNILNWCTVEVDGVWTLLNRQIKTDIRCNHHSRIVIAGDSELDEMTLAQHHIVDADGQLLVSSYCDNWSDSKIIRSGILEIGDGMRLSITVDNRLLLNVSVDNPEGQLLDSDIAAMCGSRVLSKPGWSRKKVIANR